MHYPPSKLPQVGLTIFSEMSALANATGAINLSQGFPNYDGPPELLERVHHHIQNGANQYAHMTGDARLRAAIAAKILRCYERHVNADTEITVTSGATEAIFSAITAVVSPGDEVIVFDPAYDSYAPAITLNGGRAIHIPLLPPRFAIDWDRVKSACSAKTRLLILNTPHNPSGQVLSAEDISQLRALVNNTDILILSDEVYEHIIYDGQTHQSMNRWPDLAERSFIVSSFGKTYHVTGWKLGYCVAPAALSDELRKVHQFVTFCCPNPLQQAIADFMENHPEYDDTLAGFYQEKRDHLLTALANSPFGLTPAAGTYYQLIDYRDVSDLDDLAFARWLTESVGVAAIPLSPFYVDGVQTGHVRLCFAKTAQTLSHAAEKLATLTPTAATTTSIATADI